ncbi:pentatricopeptide repeat domain-containing protein [Colletotrichum orchidophilum]|uniref:Pentatricopeptide repeat domain-containing protein n=1 Tax=Colletotrichum orchidophilum TaxID=1209926 RepID=A0A1G4AN68_9PEZI|nr:pentatricopeptide repeat domain-containing protein [Colletotrichum orchidophilum]OHE90536.1 pentatricopeptide repeat domain-containing protein [Colletotrichum orchidophilum]
MQALWSRAGQAHRCGCRACFDAAGGIMRHSATRATPRKPTFSEIFTACYTSIMGTAAVLDATRKDRRRKDLDRQIEEVRTELANLVENAPTNVLKKPPAGDIANRYKGALADHVRQNPEISEILDTLGPQYKWQKTAATSAAVNKLWKKYGLSPSKEANISPRSIDYDVLMQGLTEEEQMSIKHRQPQTIRQAKAAEAAARALVYEFLDAGESILGSQQIQSAREEVVKLSKSKLPRWDQEEPNAEALNECSLELNQVLRSIFAASTPSNIPHTVFSLCHNILVSPQALTIHTYNHLIAGLDRVGLHPLASAAVNAFYRGQVEPTQHTMVCLLNHFREMRDADGFAEVIARMTGKDQRGIKIRRKTHEEVELNHKLHGWVRKKDVAIGSQYIVERARFDANIFTAIIEGMLAFDRLRAAVGAFAASITADLRVSARTVSDLLDCCVRSLDHKAAAEVLKVLATKPQLIGQVFTQESDQLRLAGRIQSLLEICGFKHMSPASVAPFLKALPTSFALSEEQRRGIDIARIVHFVEHTEWKLKSVRKLIQRVKSGDTGWLIESGSPRMRLLSRQAKLVWPVPVAVLAEVPSEDHSKSTLDTANALSQRESDSSALDRLEETSMTQTKHRSKSKSEALRADQSELSPAPARDVLPKESESSAWDRLEDATEAIPKKSKSKSKREEVLASEAGF